jgi:hypothetical protein
MNKHDLISRLRGTVEQPPIAESTEKTTLLESVKVLREAIDSDGEWRPNKTSVKVIWKKMLFEANQIEQTDKRNAFRLNVQPIAMDAGNVKFSFMRNGIEVVSEILYPNKDGNITVRVSVDGADDNIKNISTEDSEYVNGLGFTIVQMADESLQNKDVISDMGMGDVEEFPGGPSNGLTGFAPTWESTTGQWDADSNRIADLMTLVEQDNTDDLDDEDPKGIPGDVNLDGGPNETLGEDEFADDTLGLEGFDEETGFDVGGGAGGGGFSGGSFGGASEGGEGEDGVDGPVADDDEYLSFREFALIPEGMQVASIREMGKLVTKSMGDQIAHSDGIVLGSEQLYDGTTPYKNTSKEKIVDDFLQIYKDSLDREFTISALNRIDEELSKESGTFPAWLTTELSSLTGESEVEDLVATNPGFNEDDMGDDLDAELGDGLDAEADFGEGDLLDDVVSDLDVPSVGDEEVDSDEVQAELDVKGEVGNATSEYQELD